MVKPTVYPVRADEPDQLSRPNWRRLDFPTFKRPIHVTADVQPLVDVCSLCRALGIPRQDIELQIHVRPRYWAAAEVLDLGGRVVTAVPAARIEELMQLQSPRFTDRQGRKVRDFAAAWAYHWPRLIAALVEKRALHEMSNMVSRVATREALKDMERHAVAQKLAEAQGRSLAPAPAPQMREPQRRCKVGASTIRELWEAWQRTRHMPTAAREVGIAPSTAYNLVKRRYHIWTVEMELVWLATFGLGEQPSG